MKTMFTAVSAYAEPKSDNIRVSVHKFFGDTGQIMESEFVSENSFTLDLIRAKRLIANLSVEVAKLEEAED
jgi:hypothetical protein